MNKKRRKKFNPFTVIWVLGCLTNLFNFSSFFIVFFSLLYVAIETLRKQIEEQQQQAVVEESIPINLNLSYSENDDGIEQDKSDNNKKKDWSSSLRLWSQESEKDNSTTVKIIISLLIIL